MQMTRFTNTQLSLQLRLSLPRWQNPNTLIRHTQMPKHLIPPVISKPASLLSASVHTHNPRGAKSTGPLRDLNNPLLVLGRESFLHNLIDLLRREDNIESLVYPFRSRDIDPFAPIARGQSFESRLEFLGWVIEFYECRYADWLFSRTIRPNHR
jgi:hypothetical protein